MLSPVVLLLTFLPFSVVGLHVFLEGFVLSQACVKPVFYVIVDTSGHEFLNLHPFVAKVLVKLHQLKVFCDCPLLLVQVWIDVIVPTLSALFSDSSRQKRGNLLPFLEPILSNLFPEDHVFLWGPVSFDLLDGAIFSVVSEVEPSVH